MLQSKYLYVKLCLFAHKRERSLCVCKFEYVYIYNFSNQAHVFFELFWRKCQCVFNLPGQRIFVMLSCKRLISIKIRWSQAGNAAILVIIIANTTVKRKYCGDQNKMARKENTHTRTKETNSHASILRPGVEWNEMNEIERVKMETPTQPTSVSENLYLESTEKNLFRFFFCSADEVNTLFSVCVCFVFLWIKQKKWVKREQHT